MAICALPSTVPATTISTGPPIAVGANRRSASRRSGSFRTTSAERTRWRTRTRRYANPKNRASSPNAPGTASATQNIAAVEPSSARRKPPSSTSSALVSPHAKTLHAHQSAASTSIPRSKTAPGRVVGQRARHLGQREDEDQVEEVARACVTWCSPGSCRPRAPGAHHARGPPSAAPGVAPPTQGERDPAVAQHERDEHHVDKHSGSVIGPMHPRQRP